jgi:putative PIN family toxin of toxin-antitoxin system
VRLVLDTNTVLALWLFADPALEPLRRLCREPEVTLLASPATFDELHRVLGYPEFHLSDSASQQLLTEYRQRLTLVTGPVLPAPWPLPRCKDPDDQKFLQLARDGHSQYLLTRDEALLKLARRKCLFGRFAILSPEQFLSQLPVPQESCWPNAPDA